MRQIRWVAQASQAGYDDWVDRYDVVYAGWFHFSGDSTPSDSLMESFDEAVATHDWLDWRLIEEVRTHTTKVVKRVDRDEH